MSAHLPAVQLLTVVLALAGAGVALAGGTGLVAVVVRVGDAASPAGTRRAVVLWAVGALLLAVGTPGVLRGMRADAPTTVSLAVVGVVAGAVAVAVAPLSLWSSTLDGE